MLNWRPAAFAMSLTQETHPATVFNFPRIPMTSKQKQWMVAVMAANMIGGVLAAEPHEHGHHHQFAKDVDAFHGVLAPVWHAAPGKARNRNACSKAGQMARLANDIRSADASGLQAGVAALKKQCRRGKGDVEGALFDVHEAFHRLIEPGRGA